MCCLSVPRFDSTKQLMSSTHLEIPTQTQQPLFLRHYRGRHGSRELHRVLARWASFLCQSQVKIAPLLMVESPVHLHRLWALSPFCTWRLSKCFPSDFPTFSSFTVHQPLREVNVDAKCLCFKILKDLIDSRQFTYYFFVNWTSPHYLTVQCYAPNSLYV